VKKTKKPIRVGIMLLVGAPASIPVVWLLLQGCMGLLAAASSAPDQGAMVIAFLVFIVWCVVAVAAVFIGLLLIVIGATER
jgi:hypothetical protein